MRGSVKEFRTRLLLTMWGVGLAIAGLVTRLYALQILRGEELTSKGRRNFVQQVQVPHDRGIIYDRRGHILVDNRPSLDLQVTPAFLGRRPAARATLTHVAELLQMPDEDVRRVTEQVEARGGLDRFRPVTVRRDLSPEQVEAIEAERSVFLLDGIDIAEGRRRTYHFGPLAAHLLGYVNEIDQAALEAERGRGNPERYGPGDSIGREGVERTYEKELRGTDGVEKVVVDAKGRRQQMSYVDLLLGEQRRVDPVPGHNVFLTLDLELQQVAEAAFAARGRAGSVVALDVATGGVLVLASLPAYDSNKVSGAMLKQVKEKLDADPLKPWINRSIAGQYAPGSTFKVVTGLAALKAGVTQPHEKVGCPGYYRLGRHVWRCWRDAGHGMMDLHDALRVSCDTYFYTVAGRMGIDPISHMAKLLSFGGRTGIPLRGEQPGLAPDEAFHNRVDAATGGYQKGMAINTAIGQGSLLVTPLQLAVAYAAVANGQATLAPQLVARIESADLRVTRRFVAEAPPPGDFADALIGADGVPQLLARHPDAEAPVQTEVRGDGPLVVSHLAPRPTARLQLADADLAAVRDGLRAVTSEAGGTGFYSRSRKVSMAGKTGTAQVVRLGRERLKQADTEYEERDHAWYVAYAPAEAPQIVVAVLNEHAGHGGSASAPVAVAVIDAFFAQQEATPGHPAGAAGSPP